MMSHLAGAVVAGAALTGADQCAVTVPGLGDLQGAVSTYRSDVAFFGSIPYALPPVGDLRWQPPKAHGPWDSPRDATGFGAACHQQTPHRSPAGPNSEDCLTLNVATPLGALNSAKSLPTMLWIHGGTYKSGAGSDNRNDALVAASELSVVVVTANYRINVFGFLGSDAIQERSEDGSAGNFGIQDQRLAMAWVAKHIGAFGGDGSDVTIFGESAGGNSLLSHLAAPASFPYYQKVIIESGAYTSGAITLEDSALTYEGVLYETNCSDLTCLLSWDAAALESKMGTLGPSHSTPWWHPVVDGIEKTAAPADVIEQGKHNRDASVLIGSNRDETAAWGGVPADETEAQFNWANAKYGSDLQTIKELYDPERYQYPSDLANYSRWSWTQIRVDTDQVPGLGHCGARSMARSLLNGGTHWVYLYLFAHPTQGTTFVGHGDELPYVFGDFTSLASTDDQAVASAMALYWSSFAVAGRPGHAGYTGWPQYSIDGDATMVVNGDPSAGGAVVQGGVRGDACDFWDTYLKTAAAVV